MVRRDASDPGVAGATSDADVRPGAGGEEARSTGGDVRCKLLRGDGSEWTVTDLALEADGLHVSAYRYVREGHTTAAARRETLEDELLTRADRVWCLNRRGAVVWDLSRPDPENLPREEDGAGDVG